MTESKKPEKTPSKAKQVELTEEELDVTGGFLFADGSVRSVTGTSAPGTVTKKK